MTVSIGALRVKFGGALFSYSYQRRVSFKLLAEKPDAAKSLIALLKTV